MAEGEALREVFVRFSAEVEGEDELHHLGESADEAKAHVKEAGEHAEKAEGLFKTLGEAVEGVAAVFGASELLKGIRETTEGLEQLAHLSEQTGVATEQLEFYGFVVGQVGGDVSDFRMNLSALQRGLSATEAGVAPQTAALKKLGIETRNADGSSREMNEVLPEIFANFGNLKDANEETAVATRLFGKSGLALLPVLREGAKGFDEYREAFEASGGATPKESIERAKEYEKALKRMNAAFDDLKTHLVTGVLPALTHVVEGVTDFTSGLSHFLKGTTAASHVTLALAAALAGPLMRSLGPFLKPGLKFLAIYAAVDDVLAFLEGKDSLTGRVLKGLFGDGTADKVRAWANDAKNAFTDFAGSAQATYEALTNANSTFTEKAIASFVAFVRDASQGFPAMGLSFASSLDGMLASLVGFIASALEKWNTFVQGVTIPPWFKALAGVATGGAAVPVLTAAEGAAKGAQVNTSGLRADEGSLRAASGDLATQSLASIAGLRSNALGTAAGGTVARQFLADQAAAGPAARTARAPATKEEIAQSRAGEQFAVLGAAHAAGVTATVHQNNEVKINLPAGVSRDSELAKMVGEAVSKALKDNNRTALQQITQRGSK